MSKVSPIVVPQLNVNDETVQVASWLVEHGATVSPGEAVCEVETSKAIAELIAENAGVVFQTAAPHSSVRVGQRVGLIGPSLGAVEAYLSDQAGAQDGPDTGEGQRTPLKSTPRALALAADSGIALEHVAAMGVVGTIKEQDVRRYLSERGAREAAPDSGGPGAPAALPPALLRYVMDEGALSRHELSVTQALHQSLQGVLLATLDVEVDLTAISRTIRQAQERGTMLSLLHVVIWALGRTLPHYPRFVSFHHDGRMYRYRGLDVAFVVRTSDRRLYTPAVRGVDRLEVKQIARACHAAAIGVNRGRVKQEELEGACFTVSHIPTGPVARFVALPNRFQSAILAIAADHGKLTLRDGQVSEDRVATLTLSYDHTLCDGVYAADFLQRLMNEMELAAHD